MSSPAVAHQAPAGEAGRLRALARYAILDTPRDEAFDDLAEIARGVTGSPIAGIAFFDQDRVWFKTLLGAEPEDLAPEHLLRPGGSPEAPDLPGGTGELASSLRRGAFAAAPCVTADGYTLGCLFVAGFGPEGLERKQTEDLDIMARQVLRLLELRRTLLSYHTIVDGVGNVVFHLDEAERIVSLTPTWSQLSGFGLVRSLGRPLSDFVHPDDRPTVDAWLRHVRTGAVPPPAQCRLLRLTQDDVPVEILARPLIDETGRLRGLVGVIADVSERHEREVETRHVQKLEALGRLSAGLSHEINTPIQFVGDNARFLADCYEAMFTLITTYREVLDEHDTRSWADRRRVVRAAEAEADLEYLVAEVPAAVAQSLRGIDRVASLVRAMKTFSHPGTGEQSEADLNEALRATVTVANNQLRQVAAAVLDLGDLPPVRCNIGDLNQVFLNMVINAADAIEETGRHGTITVTSRTDGDHVAVDIADTGAGVPEDLRRRIFEPFFTTKSVGRGTGQGLALARAVVRDQHGGTITLRSEPGAGTTFTVRLPIAGRADDTGETT